MVSTQGTMLEYRGPHLPLPVSSLLQPLCLLSQITYEGGQPWTEGSHVMNSFLFPTSDPTATDKLLGSKRIYCFKGHFSPPWAPRWIHYSFSLTLAMDIHVSRVYKSLHKKFWRKQKKLKQTNGNLFHWSVSMPWVVPGNPPRATQVCIPDCTVFLKELSFGDWVFKVHK